MVFISAKTIREKKRYYLEKSIRLPTGKVKKYSVYLKDYQPSNKNYDLKQYEERLRDKIREELTVLASRHYKKDVIYDKALLGRLEEIRLGYKDITSKLSKKQLEDIIDRFTINFTYESNAIEGSSLTLKDVTFILHENRVVKDKDLKEVNETLNTREAMQLVFDNKLKINEADIIKLHKILVKGTGITVGYKKLPNFLLGRRIETTLPEKVEQEMKTLIDWYHQNKAVHPLQRAAVFHGRFERMHPFEDGNGRVGRLLINIILLSNGYPPLIIRKTQRVSYLGALEAFDNNYEGKLNRFLIDKYKDTYKKFFKIYIKYLR